MSSATLPGRQAFRKNSIYEILCNPKYAGYYTYNRAPRRLNGKRNWRIRKDEGEISPCRALSRLSSRGGFQEGAGNYGRPKKTGPRQKSGKLYFLTGKVVCGECGAAMVGNSSSRKAGAEPVRYYECNRKMRTRDCGSRRIRKDYLENYVLGVVEQNMFSRDKLPELAGKLVMLARDKGRQNARDEKVFNDELADIDKRSGI